MKRNRTEKAIRDLLESWERDMANYPDTAEGKYAAVIVGLCAEELKEAVWGPQTL